MTKIQAFVLALAGGFAAFASHAQAASSGGILDQFCQAQSKTAIKRTVIVERGDTVVFQDEIAEVLAQIPERHVAQFARSDRLPERLQQMSLSRLIATDALEAGILDNPEVLARMTTLVSEFLAAAKRKAIRDPDSVEKFAQRAKELHMTNPEQFRTEGTVSFQQLFISESNRSEAEAARAILEAYDRLQSGEEFSALISEYSEDESQPEGGYTKVATNQWPEKFQQVLSRAEPGSAVLGPFTTDDGWHLVRLNERHPGKILQWEESRQTIIERVARDHQAQELRRYIRKISQATPNLNEDALEAIRTRYAN